MAINAIERVELAGDPERLRAYVYARKPVVISDLFTGQPIRGISSLRDAKEAFGSSRLAVQTEYVSARVRKNERHGEILAFNEYWEEVSRRPATRLLCSECEIPSRVMTEFTLPRMCLADDLEDNEILGFPRKYGDHDLLTNVFIANQGNKAHMHYDGDHRQVLLYQVFGRKEVILFHPASGARFSALGDSQIFLNVFFDKLGEQERLRIVDEADGYHVILHPGEAVYIPMLMWHYLNYIDDGMSFNIRFGRNNVGRFLCADNFHRDFYIQNFGALLADRDRCNKVFAESIRRIIGEYLRDVPSLEEKIRGIRLLFRELCASFCSEVNLDEFYGSSSEETVVRTIVKEMGSTIPYRKPEETRLMRPTGPLSPAQRRHITEGAVRCGYRQGILEHIIFNRTGKSHLDLLTKAEGAQVMAYLSTPGATW